MNAPQDGPRGVPRDVIEISLTVNGEPVRRLVPARLHLADFLREELGLTGTHLGCEHGICGACSVRIDGDVVRGCLTLTAQINGRVVETIEGASEAGDLVDLQAEFLARNAAQCGFCTSGMLLTAQELLGEPGEKSREEIREFMSGNFCRCTGYQAIIDAVEAVQAKRGGHG
jgi:carbon-monoxide dehydrogenase small subunit